MSAAAQIECADAKAWFCLRKYYFYYIQNFTFYILPFTFLRVSARGPSPVTLSGAANET